MNLLFAVNDGFVDQMLTSVYSILENTQDQLDFYVLQKKKLQKTKEIEKFASKTGAKYHPVVISDEDFSDFPVTDRYPETIYYRLLAHKYLPNDIKRILYLDADVLCINDLSRLYELDFEGNLYAAASHSGLTNVKNVINNVRLGAESGESYFNSGVLLMNLEGIRRVVDPQKIVEYVEKNKLNLLLPDQDVLNGLYGQKIKKVEDELYNYDVRKNPIYEAISMGEWDLDWVIKNTVVLHFCGRDKPWDEDYIGRFAGLYKYYFKKAMDVML